MVRFCGRSGFRAAGCLAFAALLAGCAAPQKINRMAEFQGPIASIPKEWSEEPVVVLSDSVDIRFVPGKDGNRVRRRQATWYFVQHRNPTVLEHIVVPEYLSIETQASIEATAYWPGPGGGSWSPGALDMARVRQAEEPLHSSDRYLTGFRFPKYVQGMLIRLAVDRTYTHPEFLKSEILRDDYPSLSKVVTLELPAGSGIKHGFLNPEGLPVDSARSADGASQTLTLRAGRLAKLEARTMPRNPESWYGALHFSLPAKGARSLSWQELGDAYLAAIASAFETSPELEKLAGDLPRTLPDSLIRKVYSVLRGRIRYHADLEILHAFVPRKAGEVLAKGYGDCKEMATLMTQILRNKGVKGVGVALVSTPGTLSVVEEFPTLGGFNHMIVYAEGPDGSIRHFDPTVKHGDPEDSYYDLIGRTALILKDGASRLRPVAMAPGFRNRVETRNAIRNDRQGWSLVGSIRLEGQCAFSLLPTLNAAMGEEKVPLLKTFLKELFAVDAAEASLVETGDRSIEISYRAPFLSNYLSMDKGGFLMSWPSLYGGDVRFTSVDVEGPRHLQKFEQADSWEIPPGFDDLEKADLEHALARGKWSRKGDRILRTYASDAGVVPPEKRGLLAEYMTRRNTFVRATLWHR